MNDEETVALTAGGHTFGKAHGAGEPMSVPPEAADISLQGLGWASANGTGIGDHTITSGIEGSWANTPTQWWRTISACFFEYDYELVKSPAGAQQWQPINQKPEDMAPAAHDPSKRGADDDDDRRHGAEDGSRVPQDLRAVPQRTMRRSTMPSLAPGSNSPTATWGRRSATSGRKCREKT